MKLHNETVTVFNRVASRNGTDTWYATVLKNVHVDRSMGKLRQKCGQETNNRILISSSLDGYKRPKEWKPGDGFTLQENRDLVYLGDWPWEKKISVNKLKNELEETFDDVYTVHTVSQFRIIPHLEIACG